MSLMHSKAAARARNSLPEPCDEAIPEAACIEGFCFHLQKYVQGESSFLAWTVDSGEPIFRSFAAPALRLRAARRAIPMRFLELDICIAAYLKCLRDRTCSWQELRRIQIATRRLRAAIEIEKDAFGRHLYHELERLWRLKELQKKAQEIRLRRQQEINETRNAAWQGQLFTS